MRLFLVLRHMAGSLTKFRPVIQLVGVIKIYYEYR
jgi:hypothetical protein